jgi:hypothetical protein
MNERCEHDLLIGMCAVCKFSTETGQIMVYMTRGGDSYHSRPDCEWLTSGQNWAYAKGLKNHPILPLPLVQCQNFGACGLCV